MIQAHLYENGELIGVVALSDKNFSTGSRGFYASRKVDRPANGKRYQANFSLVEIDSKKADKK